MGDPFLMLAEEHTKDLYEEARIEALAREAQSATRGAQRTGISGLIARAFGRRTRWGAHAARSMRVRPAVDAADRDEPRRRPAA
jgi:hypothetical protein